MMVKSKKLFCMVFTFFTIAFSLNAQVNRIRFSDFTINEKNELLFSLETQARDGTTYKSLFIKRGNESSVEQVTFFPERLEVFAEGSIVQVSNALGSITLTIDSSKLPESFNLKQFSLFDQSEWQQNFESLQVSHTGRFVSIVEPVDFVFGNLVLFDLKTGEKWQVTQGALQHIRVVSFAPDDSSFVYENNGSLYFSRPSWLVDESYKASGEKFTNVKLSSGAINFVTWLDKDTFYLIEGASLYQVSTHNLLTFSLYDSLLQVKKKIATLPFAISAEHDQVYFSTLGTAILVVKNSRHLYYIEWKTLNKIIQGGEASIPYLLLPVYVSDFKVFWQNEMPFVYFNAPNANKNVTLSFKVSSGQFLPNPLQEGEVFLSFSPYAKYALVKKENVFYVKDLTSQQYIFRLDATKIVSSVWANDNILLVGTESELVKVNLQKIAAETLLLSQVGDFSWNKRGDTVLAYSHSKPDQLLEHVKEVRWAISTEGNLQPKKTSTSQYRAFLDETGGIFSNMIYLRSLTNVGTSAILPVLPSFQTSTSLNTTNTKKIALIFDCLESFEGLEKVLFTLKQASSKATFFMTSTAITAYPEAATNIVQNGHQSASLFLAPINLSDSKYNITEDFIKSGLARTEDLFYKATKSDLSLYWHTPWYVSSKEIETIGKRAGYTFVLPTIITPDWLPSLSEILPQVATSSYECINYILSEVTDGSIIAVQLGKSEVRSDYLYENIELLVSLLQKYGYEIVPVKDIY